MRMMALPAVPAPWLVCAGLVCAGLLNAASPCPAQGQTPATGTEGTLTRLAERLKIGGEFAFELYDRRAESDLPAALGGPDGGVAQFWIRRLDLDLGIDIIEDFNFQSTVRFDPVVMDQEGGTVDVKEAFFRFGNLTRHFFGVEDPSHTYFQLGTFYRWQRQMFGARTEARPLTQTSFYYDEVTGIAVGGNFDVGPFYRLSLTNGNRLALRNAGAGGRGEVGDGPKSQAIVHDHQQLGDLTNSKEFEAGAGLHFRSDDQMLGATAGGYYRTDRLSGEDVALINTFAPGLVESRHVYRIGALASFDVDSQYVNFGVTADVVRAYDGRFRRNAWSISPRVTLKLDGAYYQGRKFFTALDFIYAFSQLHQKERGLSAAPGIMGLPLDDRDMHTFAVALEVTRNVRFHTELTLFDEKNVSVDNTEWLSQLRIRF